MPIMKARDCWRPLKKYKETWEKKLADVNAKAFKITAKKKSSQESLDIALLSQQELEENVSKLTDEMVSNFGVYFECSKE